MLGAAIATFFFPVISLIAALMLMSGQQNDRKRGQLRTWAWVSAGWILLQVLFGVLLLAVFMTTTTAISPAMTP